MSMIYSPGARRIEVTHPDRVVFPDGGFTKLELVDYYNSIAPLMTPHLRERPLNMERVTGGEPFIQQAAPDYFPEWVPRARVAKEGGEVEHAVCNSQAALVYLANQNCVTFHVWLSRVSHIDRPDRVTFDLDPASDDFEKVREAAFIFKDMLEDLGLLPHAMTTGSRGVHVVAPLRRGEPFDTVRAFAREMAGIAAERRPDLLTVEQRKEKRGDRVYVDTLRNSYGHTAVAPYSVRVKAGAPVATPLTWEELGDRATGPQTFNIHNILKRTGRTGDPWAGMSQHARSLRQPGERLELMRAAR